MTPRYSLLPAADRDLDERVAYLAGEASLETALRFFDAAAATFEKIARMPGIGERWNSPRPRLAELRVGRVHGFEIFRILHGSRDINSMLESEDAD